MCAGSGIGFTPHYREGASSGDSECVPNPAHRNLGGLRSRSQAGKSRRKPAPFFGCRAGGSAGDWLKGMAGGAVVRILLGAIFGGGEHEQTTSSLSDWSLADPVLQFWVVLSQAVADGLK